MPQTGIWTAHRLPWEVTVPGGSCGSGMSDGTGRGGPAIYHQLLLYPALDASLSQPSYQTCGQGFGLTKK
ncbi:hypothetical protein ERHA55_52840 (plasmid) [Erwinia rhapontici]|nr:hypothetical protein ERHA55_52840 [Erwinia rhapontici]